MSKFAEIIREEISYHEFLSGYPPVFSESKKMVDELTDRIITKLLQAGLHVMTEQEIEEVSDNASNEYDMGFDDGIEVGKDLAYAGGLHEGRGEGYRDGYEDGRAEGYREGYDDGTADGFHSGRGE